MCREVAKGQGRLERVEAAMVEAARAGEKAVAAKTAAARAVATEAVAEVGATVELHLEVKMVAKAAAKAAETVVARWPRPAWTLPHSARGLRGQLLRPCPLFTARSHRKSTPRRRAASATVRDDLIITVSANSHL